MKLSSNDMRAGDYKGATEQFVNVCINYANSATEAAQVEQFQLRVVVLFTPIN